MKREIQFEEYGMPSSHRYFCTLPFYTIRSFWSKNFQPVHVVCKHLYGSVHNVPFTSQGERLKVNFKDPARINASLLLIFQCWDLLIIIREALVRKIKDFLWSYFIHGGWGSPFCEIISQKVFNFTNDMASLNTTFIQPACLEVLWKLAWVS